MAISKRTRAEVLRRDDYACRYCHATDSPLTIDHVMPTALGGLDVPSNLVAACKDCNAGKASTAPDASLVAQVSDDAVRWAAAMKVAAERLASNKAAVAEELQPWFDWWEMHAGPGWSYKLPDDADQVLTGYVAAGMPLSMLVDALHVAMDARRVDNRFRYFQGVANNRLAELQRDAKAILADDEPRKYTDAEVREDKAYWRGFDEAFRTPLVADGFVWARALSRVVDGANPYNTHSEDLGAAGWPGWDEWMVARS